MADKIVADNETAAAFSEFHVEADGFRIRYMAAGQGTPLIHLHGAGGPRLSRGLDLLSQHYRVITLEMPGFGRSAENTRTATMPDLAATIASALTAMQIDRYNLLGTSFGGKVALWLAVQQPERVLGLVLDAPSAPDRRRGRRKTWRAGSTRIPNACRRCRQRTPRSRRRQARW